jgi:hypothetical protein
MIEIWRAGFFLALLSLLLEQASELIHECCILTGRVKCSQIGRIGRKFDSLGFDWDWIEAGCDALKVLR